MPLVISEAGVVRKAHISDEVISSPNYAMGAGEWVTLYDKSTWVPGTLNELKDIGTLQHVGNNTRGNYIVLPETGIYMLHLRAYFKIEYVQRTENPYAVVLPFTYNVIDSNGTLFDYVHSTIVAPNSGGSNLSDETQITGQNTHLYVSGKKGDKFKIQIRFDAGINLTTGALNNISKVLFNTMGNKGYLAVSISKLSEIVLDN